MKTNFKSNFVLFIVLLSSINFANAQSDFDAKLNAISDSVAAKINQKGKTKVGVWDFTDADGQTSNIGKYISEEMSVDLTNSAKTFTMMDRNHLNTIMKEHRLNAEGFIDANTAKELGMMKAVDAIVTGTITIFGDNIKLTVKVLDTETAMIIAATKGDLPMTPELESFLGVPGMNKQNQGSSSRGFNNVPLNSNEQYNNPETAGAECEKNNWGTYCFENATQHSVEVSLSCVWCQTKALTLDPGQTNCFYRLDVSKDYEYDIKNVAESSNNNRPGYNGHFPQATTSDKHGQVLVEKCKSKTFVIK